MCKASQRTCVGCGKKDHPSALWRLVYSRESQVEVDFDRCLPGRGAWIHRNSTCAGAGLTSPRLARALRVSSATGVNALAAVEERLKVTTDCDADTLEAS